MITVSHHACLSEVEAEYRALANALGLSDVWEGAFELHLALQKLSQGQYPEIPGGDTYKLTSVDIHVFREDSEVIGMMAIADYRASYNGFMETPDECVDDEALELLNCLWVFPSKLLMLPGAFAKCYHLLPSFTLDDTSFKYSADHYGLPGKMAVCPANVVDLTTGNYLESLNSGHRREMKKCLAANADIEVRVEDPPEAWAHFSQSYFDWWVKKGEPIIHRITGFHIILDWARKHGHLIALAFYLNGKLVAVNYAIKSGDTVIDYLCLWDTSLLERRLGTLAIIKNIEHCASIGLKWYDLAAAIDTQENPYKRKFVNTAQTFCCFATWGGPTFEPGDPPFLPPFYDKRNAAWVM